MTDPKAGVVDFRGTAYYTVARRVNDFREKHPIDDGWGLLTKMVHADAETVLFRAAIVDPQGKEVAVGFAEEKRTNRGINSTSALEVCETSAIGRALAAAGLGGSGEYASADELASALNQQRNQERPAANTSPKVDATAAHKSWADDRDRFANELAGRGILYKTQIVDLCKQQEWTLPRTWTNEGRTSFLKDLDAGKFKAVFDPVAHAAAQKAS